MLGLAAFLVRENPLLVEIRVHGQACGQGQGGAGDALADGRHEVQALHQSADGSGGQGVAGHIVRDHGRDGGKNRRARSWRQTPSGPRVMIAQRTPLSTRRAYGGHLCRTQGSQPDLPLAVGVTMVIRRGGGIWEKRATDRFDARGCGSLALFDTKIRLGSGMSASTTTKEADEGPGEADTRSQRRGST